MNTKHLQSFRKGGDLQAQIVKGYLHRTIISLQRYSNALNYIIQTEHESALTKSVANSLILRSEPRLLKLV